MASNDLKIGEPFSYTMAAKDESFSFDFGGIYEEGERHQRIVYTLDDGRKVAVHFKEDADLYEHACDTCFGSWRIIPILV